VGPNKGEEIGEMKKEKSLRNTHTPKESTRNRFQRAGTVSISKEKGFGKHERNKRSNQDNVGMKKKGRGKERSLPKLPMGNGRKTRKS